MINHLPTTPEELNFHAELKAASHWCWSDDSNQLVMKEALDNCRLKIAVTETLKTWKEEEAELQRSKDNKMDKDGDSSDESLDDQLSGTKNGGRATILAWSAKLGFILAEIENDITKQPTPMKPNPTPPATQLAICLYRLTHGCTLLTVGDLFGIAAPTAHCIFLDVCKAIVKNLYDRFVFLPRTNSGIDHVQPVFESVHVAADENDSRLRLSQELEAIRSKIVRGELVLFVGEQLSTLVTPENQSPSLDDWWQIVTHPSKDGFKALLDLEEKFLRSLQLGPSRVHNVLRNVGNFPLIITTNMDELLERFLWKTENPGEKIRLDQISCLANSWPDPRRDVVIKCLGDASINARVLPSSKKYFEDFCNGKENTEVEFMRQLFNERSILFLGCDPNREEYMNIFRKFAVSAQMKHYKFETHSKSDLEESGNLLTMKANLQPWEFVQFFSTGTIKEEIQPGKVYERSYLRHQLAEYLQQQLALEKMASEIVFHTISITSALSPDDFFEQVSLPTIQNIFTQNPFGVYSEEKVQRTMAAMKARRDNLIKMIKESKTKVTALFFYHGVKNEIELWKKEAKSEEEKQRNLKKCKISISKYAKTILLCKSFLRNKSSLEIRIVGDQDTYKVQEVERETFALIRLKGGQDEAICYAETATSPQSRKFANHLININGEEVLNKRRIYERSRANAWSNEESVLRLANALTKENNEIQKEGFGISAIDKDDLEKLEALTRVSHKVRSQLDLSVVFERLGAGSYGEVFKAERKGELVAVKILKDVEHVKQIEYYEREVYLLSKAKHPNIVGVIGCLAIDNNLAIVMELVLGGNLKQFLKKDLKVAEKKEFTVRFVEHIGSAIEYLHSLNIIHRDVKPDSILLSEDHKVFKLGDLGIAGLTEGTEQTKTMIGAYRYVAPDVLMAPHGHYSKRADVYSFGLCLIEVLSQGKVVFAHIADDEAVMDRKKHGEKPNIPEISVHEFGEELAKKLKVITEECLRPESSRPEMSGVLGMLRGELTANNSTVELNYYIGTGSGTTGRGDEENVTKTGVYAFKNCLVTAQNMLAEIYGNNYPLSKTVEKGLQRLLDQRYNGRLDDFMTNFITPTETLLRRAKVEGFSLVKDGLVIIHLVAPIDHLENAEMFYQVGHTYPGVLAVQFTKYQGRNVIQLGGNIDDEELHGAFTQRYLERLRAEALDLGDQLMRILLTSKENVSGDYYVEKVEVKKTMPRSLDESFRYHPPGTETAMPKWPGADEQPFLYGSCSEDEGSSGIEISEDCPSQEGSSLTFEDLSSSLLAQAPSGHHMASAVAFPSQQQEQLGENMSYPKYPPLLQAVKYGIAEPDIGGHTSQDGQSTAKYPPILQAVRNETEGPDSSQPTREQSCEAEQSKAKYPPILLAVRNETEDPDSSQPNAVQSCEPGQGKANYPLIFEAVRNETEDPDTTYREDEDLDLF
ncbi:PREDICTED: uncharacterized protein LOC107353184 [Acropora digitifera]|uniref:uncharacterized protein LOC107353184 n=1 Tax=Acropora digitifera TaxID=70779 RepID=UPI00077AF31E|nr:PREDICTED: uncharacterized protein LOC107353184 [Acropora digitifera]